MYVLFVVCTYTLSLPSLPPPPSSSLQLYFPYFQEHTREVEEVVHEAPEVEAQINSFKSDLVKKTTSLKAVWDKFLQRVDNRKIVLHKTVCFYERVNKVRFLPGSDVLLAALSVEARFLTNYTCMCVHTYM